MPIPFRFDLQNFLTEFTEPVLEIAARHVAECQAAEMTGVRLGTRR